MSKTNFQALLAKAKDPRQAHEMLASALHEYRMRLEREKQARPGGLMDFVRYFWDTIEPGREFVDGWALRAMAMHLEAVTYGSITRILINVSPGSMKSLLLNCFWPAWEWSAAGQPGMRYISFSYSSLLTERDNQRMLDLIESNKFQDLWGHMFKMRQKGVTKISNSKFGWKFASSVRGTGTGERADRVLCFPEETLVATENGPIAIGRIVRERLNVRVWSRSPVTGRLELRPVTSWKHNPGSDLVRVNYTGGSVRCTPDHRFWVEGRGWTEARLLKAGDVVPCSPGLNVRDVLPTDTVTQTDFGRRPFGAQYLKSCFRRYFSSWSWMRGPSFCSGFPCICGKVQMSPRSTVENTFNSARAYTELARDTERGMGFSLRENLPDSFFVEMGCAISESPLRLQSAIFCARVPYSRLEKRQSARVSLR